MTRMRTATRLAVTGLVGVTALLVCGCASTSRLAATCQVPKTADGGIANIAPMATVSVSSYDEQHKGAYDPSFAVDGMTNVGAWRHWCNDGAKDPATEGKPVWLMLEWPMASKVEKVVVYTHRGYEARDVRIEYRCGRDWKVFGDADVRGNTSTLREFLPDRAVRTDGIRLLATRGPEKQPELVRITELEVYAPGGIAIRGFQPEKPLCRAKRPAVIVAEFANLGSAGIDVQPQLTLPAGVRLVQAPANAPVRVPGGESATVVWTLEFGSAGAYELRLQAGGGDAIPAAATLTVRALPAVEIARLPYIPAPEPVETAILVGAHNCPLWESDRPEMWANVIKHPERTPALGFYSQENPEVADWETKWTAEHGISFFVYCWYRTSEGGPVTTMFSSAIEQALLTSRFVDKTKFAIMWENQAKGKAGVADEADLMDNLLPYWLEHYFKHPSYLKVDNKPVLFIYVPGNMWGPGVGSVLANLGSVENVRMAFEKMREACRQEGFAGLTILGECRTMDADYLKQMKEMGFDYSFAYCWPVPDNPTPQQAIEAQMQSIRKTQELGILPQVVTVSQAWSGWHDEGSIWKIPPPEFETLLRQARDFIATFPADQLGSKMLLLDNWNEWGEGHYIAPYREYGFGYLDAVRNVFGRNCPEPHVDLLPEDIGRGPYDTAIRSTMDRELKLRAALSKKVLKAGPREDGLIAWWAFDEEKDCPVVLDSAGNRLGGVVRDARRTDGLAGTALVCSGGCVIVPNHARLSPATSLSLTCWVRTDIPDQRDKWLVNRVFGTGGAGYRLGLLEGRPCFEVPLTPWSHHLEADRPLPVGRWVHLAGTFDGQTMRIYVDGAEAGTMDRPGTVNPTDTHICLGNFDAKHPASFTGLLDEVKLYGRALSAAEVAAQAAGPATKPAGRGAERRAMTNWEQKQ